MYDVIRDSAAQGTKFRGFVKIDYTDKNSVDFSDEEKSSEEDLESSDTEECSSEDSEEHQVFENPFQTVEESPMTNKQVIVNVNVAEEAKIEN